MGKKKKEITPGEIGELLKAYAVQEDGKGHARAGLAVLEGGGGEPGLAYTWGDSPDALAVQVADAMRDCADLAAVIVRAVATAVRDGVIDGEVVVRRKPVRRDVS